MNTGATPVAFTEVWNGSVRRRSGHPFLIFEDPSGAATEWNYIEFDRLVARCAAKLSDLGVGLGDSVHLALTNCPAFVAVWLAALRLGAWIVPSDPMATTAELAGHIMRTTPIVGLCAATRADIYTAAANDAHLSAIVEIDETDVDLDVFGHGLVSAAANAAVNPLARAAVMFTSGTTGRPKGVEITQANYSFAGSTMAAASDLHPEHRQLVVLPLFHANAQFYSFASAITAGASVALMHTFSASRFLEQAGHHHATHASLFAAPIRMILARSEPPSEPAGLRHCWYAMNITTAQHNQLHDWLGCRPRQLYGMTETIPAVLTEPPRDPKPWSLGTPTTGCLVDLDINPDGDELGIGEIVVGGVRGTSLFAGYLDDPATTAASFRTRRDGRDWFSTGDRAHRLEDGRFVFDGRRSDLLKVAGENVSTVEVEQVLGAHPDVLEAAVVGVPDDIRDEVPVAFVVAADATSPPTVDTLTEWCAQRLTKSKRPRDITLVDQLPRTSVGKIRKFLLHDAAAGDNGDGSTTTGDTS